jgi:type I restriction enzyme S subunit
LDFPVGLPPAWRNVTIGSIGTVHIGSTPSRRELAYWGGGIPWVSSGEVRFHRIDITRESLTERGYRSSSVELHPVGTVLLAMIGEGRTRGQAAILDVPAATNQNVAAIRVVDPEIMPEWLFYVFMAGYQRTRTLGSGNNQPALSKARVAAMEVPVPPRREQMRLVSELERRLSILTAVDAEVQANQRRREILSQLILRNAFDGDLTANHRNEGTEWS